MDRGRRLEILQMTLSEKITLVLQILQILQILLVSLAYLWKKYQHRRERKSSTKTPP